jgi:hypothetical protein
MGSNGVMMVPDSLIPKFAGSPNETPERAPTNKGVNEWRDATERDGYSTEK